MKQDFAYLSNDGRYLGMTVFNDTDRVIVYDPERNRAEYMSAEAGTVIIDNTLLEEKQIHRYRFTMGHEDTHLRLEVGFMLRFMAGRFHMPGASVTIPEGFYLNSDPELVDDFGVYIVPKDRAYSVHLSFSKDGRTDEALREILGQYDEYSMIREIAPIEDNDLRGHDAIYTSGSVGYYEARFQLTDQRNLLCLVTTKATDLEEILASQDFHMDMAGIRREDDSVYYS